MEVAGFGVKVVIVEPGFFRTAIGSDSRARASARVAEDSPYRAAYQRTAASVETMERLALLPTPWPEAMTRERREATARSRLVRAGAGRDSARGRRVGVVARVEVASSRRVVWAVTR